MPENEAPLSEKLLLQMTKAGLPRQGPFPFQPRLVKNRRGEDMIEKAEVMFGPKARRRGWVDDKGQIWIRDHAHAGIADHWDVQIDNGKTYVRIDDSGNLLVTK
jgi:hypothetical protein